MSVSSDEVNYIVYRYLLESGFVHTSFAFQQESAVHKTDIKGSHVKPGALISVIQKGLQYMEIEAHLRDDGTERKCITPFTLTGKHECEYAENDEDAKFSRKAKELSNKKSKEKISKRTRKESGVSEGNYRDDPMLDIEIDAPIKPISMGKTDLINDNIVVLDANRMPIVCCAINPNSEDLLAAGYSDGTTRIWSLEGNFEYKELAPADEDIAVTAIAWNPLGKTVAVCDRAGYLRIWSFDGSLLHSVKKHEKQILSAAWNKRGDVVVTTSEDCTAIAWDGNTAQVRQIFDYHTDSIVSVSWQDNITFATASADKDVFVCQLGSPVPLKHCEGSQGKLTCISWDHRGETFVTGCSTGELRLWRMDQNDPVVTFKGHNDSITSVQWAPERAEDCRIFVSSSVDGTVRVWSTDSSSPIFLFDTQTAHLKRQAHLSSSCFLYSSSTLVGAGSEDGILHVANIKSKQIVKQIKLSANEISSLHSFENRVFAITSDNTASFYITFRLFSLHWNLFEKNKQIYLSNMSSEAVDVEEKEVLDESQGSIIMGIISQLRKGHDLSKITLPTFVLEPRSMLERMSDFMAHADLIFKQVFIDIRTHSEPDPVQRFLQVVRYYLSGFHIRPKGVKKPYNPVLGEIFRCKWEFDDKTNAVYICEQVAHHPPMSAYLFASPENFLTISGEFKPKSKFLGNSVATIMEGFNTLSFTDIPNEEYIMTNPNVYGRGILFGTMFMELGDKATVHCKKSDLICELEFKVKGFFSGTLNAISGKIKRESTGELLYTLSGKWTDIIYIHQGNSSSKDEFFNANTAKIHTISVANENEQEEYESRRLWSDVTKGIKNRSLEEATAAKTKIEENQRSLVKDRHSKNVPWKQRFFEHVSETSFKFKPEIPTGKPEAVWKILHDSIFSKPSSPIHEHFWLTENENE